MGNVATFVSVFLFLNIATTCFQDLPRFFEHRDCHTHTLTHTLAPLPQQPLPRQTQPSANSPATANPSAKPPNLFFIRIFTAMWICVFCLMNILETSEKHQWRETAGSATTQLYNWESCSFTYNGLSDNICSPLLNCYLLVSSHYATSTQKLSKRWKKFVAESVIARTTWFATIDEKLQDLQQLNYIIGNHVVLPITDSATIFVHPLT